METIIIYIAKNGIKEYVCILMQPQMHRAHQPHPACKLFFYYIKNDACAPIIASNMSAHRHPKR
jgi:hypothetical protein